VGGGNGGRPDRGVVFGGAAGRGFGGAGGTNVTAGIGNSGATGIGEGGSGDPGVTERLPYCRAVCAFAPAGGGTIADDESAAGASGAASGGTTSTGGTPGAAGAAGETASPTCGHAAACELALCPEQRSAQCGDLLTAYVECLANSDASLVQECTQSSGPDLSALILDSCYGRYADWTRGCL
jgi:hypothetical protein